MRLKLDLHAHPFEAMGFPTPDVSSVGAIIKAARSKGLDGLAVTEHYSPRYGRLAKEIAERHFPGQLLIIPGQETRVGSQEVVELYLDDFLTFRFLAHPQSTYGFEPDLYGVQGIEVENSIHNPCIDHEEVSRIARHYNLLELRNSDAHLLEELGNLYNCLELEELYRLGIDRNQEVKKPLQPPRLQAHGRIRIERGKNAEDH